MSLSVQSQVMRDHDGRIWFKAKAGGGRDQYRLGVWIDGDKDELDQVTQVDYLLHPTFKRPLHTSQNRANKFSITFWTWGMFMTDVTVHFRDGHQQDYHYYLTYDLPADDGTNYIEAS